MHNFLISPLLDLLAVFISVPYKIMEYSINVGAPLSVMTYFVHKWLGWTKYLVIWWKEYINRIPTIVKEVSTGTADNPAKKQL